MSFRLKLLGVVALLASVTPASARNIVIANDDGLTSNVKALYEALKAEGHDVIVSLPCSQQSGMGGAVKIMQPLGPLETDCVNGAARVGEPGAGPMTRPGLGEDFFYVAGTPVMAMLYGIDVVAARRWGKAPDLVLSGPNIGQNVGHIVVSSGTVSNAQYAMMRGIPAIALSAGADTGEGSALANPASAVVAARTVELIERLEAEAQGAALLPAGTGLNVNFPDRIEGAKWIGSRIGSFNKYDVRFVADLPSAMGRPPQQGEASLPGLFMAVTGELPVAEESLDEAVVARKDISVSVLQIAYDAPAQQSQAIGDLLASLNSSR